MIKVLFVCLGNICRSPMAEFIFKYMINKEGVKPLFLVDSKATSDYNERYHEGIHFDAKKELEYNNIPYTEHYSKQIKKEDYDNFDYIIGMDAKNIRDILKIVGGDPKNKVHRLLDFTDNPKEVADPWYTGNFDKTFWDIKYGLESFFRYVLDKDIEENKKLLNAIFCDIIDVVNIQKGYNLRYKFKVVTREKTYFVKIHNHYLNQEEIENSKLLYTYFDKCGIPTIPLIDIKNIKNKTLYIYEFKPYKSLVEVKISNKMYFEYGNKIGKEILKLHEIPYDENVFKKLDLEKYFNRNINSLKEKENKALKLFSADEQEKLISTFTELFNEVKNEPHYVNHNDIKPTNVLIDDDNYYLIDIDFLGLTITGFNICYAIYVFAIPQFKENEKSFLRGFIQAIDPDRKLKKQLHYFLISDFANELERLSNKNYDEISKNINYIKNMLFNVDDIITKEIYEKKI